MGRHSFFLRGRNQLSSIQPTLGFLKENSTKDVVFCLEAGLVCT